MCVIFSPLPPPSYPIEPPRVRFETKVYHPNIDSAGRICLSILQTSNWRAVHNLASVLTSVRQLLSEPNPQHPLMTEIVSTVHSSWGEHKIGVTVLQGVSDSWHHFGGVSEFPNRGHFYMFLQQCLLLPQWTPKNEVKEKILSFPDILDISSNI